MTPYQLARTECANFVQRDGSCLGVQPEGLLDSTVRAIPRERCLLAEKPIQPCQYFENCVLPLADRPGPKDNPGLQSQRVEARRQYLELRKVEVPESNVRLCPECQGPLAKRQRLCGKCRIKRRREAYRQAKQRKRHNPAMPVHS